MIFLTTNVLLFICLFSSVAEVKGFASVPSHTSQQQGYYEPVAARGAVADTDKSSSATADSKTLSLFSPCKINLFLRIIRKREDGFHDLASLFQAVGFGDTLELSSIQGQNDEFSCNMEGVPKDSSNLVLRALQLMREKTGIQQYFKADLIKQVPAQAGLGGGSANAATALWGANKLMGNPASLNEVSRAIFIYFNFYGRS